MLFIILGSFQSLAQTLYTPSGVSGIGTSSNINVGVGTSTPRSPLEISVAGNNSTIQTGLTIQQTNPSAPNNSAGVSIDFGIGNNGSNNNILGKITLKETYWSTRPKMVFSLWNSDNIMEDRMVIDSDGRLGIGTTNPQSSLDIRKPNVSKGQIVDVANFTFEGHNHFDQPGIYTEGKLILGSKSYNNAILRRAEIGFSTSDAWGGGMLKFYTTPNNDTWTPLLRMMINQNGDVGIGTITPDAKLAVKGTVHAQEVRVDLNVPGPDYVFEPTYTLPTLAETEAYIKANKHLPEVPSAKEMEANGINLSEMNMLLLKKVEELTLHLIEATKRIEQLEKDKHHK